MATAGDVFDGVAALMDDPEKDVMTVGYLTPFVNLCNKRLYENIFANPNIQGAKGAVVLVNVPAGTTSLSNYITQSGASLELLTNIFSFREKPTGTSDDNYVPMSRRQDIPIPFQDFNQNFNGIYVQTKEDILIPGASQALDFRIFGEFKPVTITSENTPILPSTDVILIHWVCEVVGMTRGATKEFIAFHEGEKSQAIDELFNALILDIQSIPVRQRPFNNQSCGFNYGWF